MVGPAYTFEDEAGGLGIVLRAHGHILARLAHVEAPIGGISGIKLGSERYLLFWVVTKRTTEPGKTLAMVVHEPAVAGGGEGSRNSAVHDNELIF